MSFGQTVCFKKEFSHLLPSLPSTSSTPKPGNGNSKPTMGQLSSFTPALRRLYLTKLVVSSFQKLKRGCKRPPRLKQLSEKIAHCMNRIAVIDDETK